MFNNLTTDNLEQAEDRLGGGFSVRETDIYTGKLKAAYAGESPKGAMSISLILDIDGSEYRETLYITNRNKENFFVKDGKKIPLPGFTIANDLCIILTGSPLSDQQTEEKVINLYDREAKKELPTKVDMLTDLLVDPEVSVAIQKIVENKTEKNESTGDYVPTEETRELNNIVKVFHTETKMTVVEAMNGAEEAKFWDAWLEKNKGQTYDKTKKASGQGGKPVSSKPTQGGNSAPKASLFGNKK